MKKRLSLLLILSAVVGMANAAEVYCDSTTVSGQKIYFTVSSSKATITNESNTTSSSSAPQSYSGNITIPATVTYEDTEYTVSAIGSYAFCGCTELDTLTFAEGNAITSIGQYAFYNCSSLTSIELPSSITSISQYTFYGSGLKSINIPAQVTELGSNSFRECTALETVTFDENSVLTTVGINAFYNCSSLTSIELPKSVTTIGGATTSSYMSCAAFYGCSSLKSISIPEGVTTLGYNCFEGCSSLETVTFKSQEKMTQLGYRCFYNCSSLTSIELPSTIYNFYSSSSNANYYASTFYGCSSLKSVVLPEKLDSLPRNCFYGCSSLTSIDIPAKVTYLGKYCFYGCSALDTITGGEALDTYDNYCFCNIGATEVSSTSFLPSTVTRLGTYVFANCTSLTKADLSGLNSSVTAVAERMFYGCSALTDLTLPSTVTALNTYSFSGTGLTAIDFTKTRVTTLGTYAFSGSALKEVTLPSTLTSVGNYAFSSCDSLTMADVQCSSIGTNCFYMCTALTDVTIDDVLTSLPNYTFYGCTSLNSVDISPTTSSITSIGTYCFYRCSALRKLIIPSKVETIGSSAFGSMYISTSYDKANPIVMKVYAATPPTLSSKMSPSTSSYFNIYVLPYSLTDFTDETTYWNNNTTRLKFYPFYDLTIGAAEAATLALPFDAVLPDGLKKEKTIYTLTNVGVESEESSNMVVGGTDLYTTDLDTLGHDTPVYIKAEAGTYELLGQYNSTEDYYHLSDSTATSTNNLLTGVYQDTLASDITVDEGQGIYVLQNQTNGNGLAFYPVSSTKASQITIGQFRAYLVYDEASSSTPSSARGISFDPEVGSQTTAINAVSTMDDASDAPVYTLQGVRVSADNLPRGIYIRDGKKFVVK